MLQANSGGFDGNQYPIMLSEGEKLAIDFPRVQQIIAGNTRRPSEMAGLPQDALTPTVFAVDDLYRRAMRDYQDCLTRSIYADRPRVEQLDLELRQRIAQQPDWARKYAYWGLAFLLVGAIPGYYIGREKNRAQEERNQRDKIDVLREGSANRRTWLIQVDAMEKERQQAMRLRIVNRAQALFEDLEELARLNQFSVSKRNELSQLNAVHQVVFPNESLTLNGVNISNYINTWGANR